MYKDEILDILEDNDLDNVEELPKAEGCLIAKFTYVFDDVELEGAEAFALEEGAERDSEAWFEEYLLPYLNDTAIDNVNDIIDDIAEDYDLDYEMLSFELSKESFNEMNFLVAFYNDELPVDIDELIMEL